MSAPNIESHKFTKGVKWPWLGFHGHCMPAAGVPIVHPTAVLLKNRNKISYKLLLWSRNSSVNIGMSNVGMSSSARCRWSPLTGCHNNRHYRTILTCTLVQSLSRSLPPLRRLCFRRCLSVCLLATLCKNFRMDLHEIFREGWQWANEQMIKF